MGHPSTWALSRVRCDIKMFLWLVQRWEGDFHLTFCRLLAERLPCEWCRWDLLSWVG